jgi:acetolactate synthase-1/2/3 large subunit
MYGTIRMHQEREYPARVYGTALRNPDFVTLAQAYGCHGERVTETAQFPAAFERARAAGRPALIELVIDPQAITAGQTIDEIRAKALSARR